MNSIFRLGWRVPREIKGKPRRSVVRLQPLMQSVGTAGHRLCGDSNGSKHGTLFVTWYVSVAGVTTVGVYGTGKRDPDYLSWLCEYRFKGIVRRSPSTMPSQYIWDTMGRCNHPYLLCSER